MSQEKIDQERFEREWLERRAQERAAWGWYAGHIRDQNLKQELAESRTKEARNACLKRAHEKNNYGFYIG